ncbi:MAG: 1-acyl-sn-glycerol-3-phosphate acyltransferase [Gammaproteobacteria bacterium]|nr:1-acyl-sn-glycerol-3-phosphate acyltransferase [Gammaproteobacteria bacterium]MCY4278172.1 1-acyl-sn-glycerol-3-phosphate acyltransferase [Gammaproteobacteria bacterium]MCY4323787.1 1-acyl-sn-glycerol-3-phosphate acyltransferase [Gammaproteobacteria bacterium]
MSDFEDIRPYHDDEVGGVLHRLRSSPEILAALIKFQYPDLARWIGPLARTLARSKLKLHFDGIDSVAAFQERLSGYFEFMVKTTTDGFRYTGLDAVPDDEPTIFISNHRDISLDSAFLNYALHLEGRQTLRIAIGDNLFSNASASDLMRLNKGFVVKRSVEGRKAMYEAMRTTSNFIRESVQMGESVWIAQRAGRAKDGFDRTDPALLKMLALAWRDEGFQNLLEHVRLVPVSISYELDPCDLAKARELFMKDRGDVPYVKEEEEDLKSIIMGLTGQKGRVRLTVGAPIDRGIETAEDASLALDQQIVANLHAFPTHEWAWREARGEAHGMEVGNARLEALKSRYFKAPEDCRRLLLMQYANLIENTRAIAADANTDTLRA